MIITRTWINDFLDISNISTKKLCKIFTSIGLEVDSVKNIKIPSNVVVGKVIETKRHENANKLNICMVDVGSSIIQVVCGAKNVKKEQYVPVAMISCKLDKDLTIKKAILRGIESNGMICSSSELGLSVLNDGILELDSSIGELILGKELKEYPLLNDEIIELELTANRGDCLSINGIARELSAYFNIALNELDTFISYSKSAIGQVLEIDCDSKVEASLVFSAINLKNFKLPLLQKLRLGIISKFTTNDIQNALFYTTHCNGVVFNAYCKNDTKINKNKLSVLNIKKDKQNFDVVYSKELLSTICVEHKDITLNDYEYIIESSYINPEVLSKRVFETKKTTGDIYYKSSRGSEPNIQEGMNFLAILLSKFGVKFYNGFRVFTEDKERTNIDVNIDKINAIIGQKISKMKIEKILSALKFDVKDTVHNILSVKVPLYRHDIKNIADITEEIVRIIGIDNIKAKPLEISEVKQINQTTLDLFKKNILRQKAVQNSFFETITYIFTNKKNLQKYNFTCVNDELDILNPIVNELNTYRSTILLNLVEAVSSNFKFGFKSVGLFEIGTVFDENRQESKKISFVFSGEKEEKSISNKAKPQNIDFFEFSKKILNSVGSFELETMHKITNNFIHPYQCANIIRKGINIGFISKLHPSVCDDFDLPDTFIAEIDFNKIQHNLTIAKAYSKFQSSSKDLSLVVLKDMEYSKVKSVINASKDANIKQFNLIDIYTDEQLGDKASLTIRFILQNDNKTLNEEEISSSLDKVVNTLNKKLNIKLRQ